MAGPSGGPLASSPERPAPEAGGSAARLVVNGEERSYPDGKLPDSLFALVGALGLEPGLAVAEVNGEIVKRGDYAARRLSDGDRVEIVRLVGGG